MKEKNILDMSDSKKKPRDGDEEIRLFKHIDGIAQQTEMALYMQKQSIDRQRLEVYDLMKQIQILKEKLRIDPVQGKKQADYDTEDIA